MSLLKTIASFRPHFLTAFIATLALASLIPEENRDARMLKTLAAFLFMWATIVLYAIEHQEAAKIVANSVGVKKDAQSSFNAPRPRIPRTRDFLRFF